MAHDKGQRKESEFATVDIIPRIHRATHALAILVACNTDLGLDQAEAHVLAYLHAAGASQINAIHAAFGHRRSTLTSVLNRLERRMLIGRSPDTSDRRSIRVGLTNSGKKLGARAHAAFLSAEKKALHGFTPPEIDKLRQMLEAFADVGRAASENDDA